MAEIKDYSVTADDNNSASPNGMPENQAPSTVNNSVRETLARVKRWYEDINGTKSTTGSSNAYVLAAARTVTAYAQGDAYLFRANHTNTGAATLNVDSVGAVAIVNNTQSALAASQIQSGGMYLVAYDATNSKFQLVGGSATSASGDNIFVFNASPSVTLENSTAEDSDGGRESTIQWKGLQSGSEESTLVKIIGSHDGSSDDQKGKLQIYTNDGSDGDSPTLQVTIDSAGLCTLVAAASVGGSLTVAGATQLNSTVTVGANDQGYDVILYGDTASANVTWDTSVDDLILNGAAGLIVPDGQLTLGSTAVTSTGAELNILDGVTASTAELNILDGVTSTTAEINILDGVTSTTAELNILDGVTSTAAELNILDGVTSTTAELNILDGVTSTAAELNYLDISTLGTTQASKAVTTDSNGDVVFPDGDKINLGTGSDLVLQHDSANSYIQNSTGSLNLQGKSGENGIVLVPDGAVTLYHDNAAKLATTSGGVQIDGTTTDDCLVIKTTEAGASTAPDVVLYRLSSSPADNDFIGKFEFRGRNDNTQDVQYSFIATQAIDVSDGTEDGRLLLSTKVAGSDKTHVTLDADGIKLDGKVGIGTTSAAAGLHIESTGTEALRTLRLAYDGTYYANIAQAGAAGLYYRTYGGLPHIWEQGGAEKMRIDSNGRLGIGLSAPLTKFVVDQGGDQSPATSGTMNTGSVFQSGAGSAALNIGTEAAGAWYNAGYSNNPGVVRDHRFLTGSTERMRINGDGRIGISSNGLGAVQVAVVINGQDWFFVCDADDGTDKFRVASSGNVQNANNSYGSTSDIKLKENIVDASNKLEELKQVKIRNFNFKGDSQKQIGVVAQELETIFPGMVENHKDRDKDGNDLGTTTKSVKYSVFVPMLIKAMQEQQTVIESLEARITALEAG
jgi:hypothetical protein